MQKHLQHRTLSLPLLRLSFKQAAAHPPRSPPIDTNLGRGFTTNTSATSRAFRMIQAETNSAHANAHGKVARHLEKSILEPFGKWAADHRQRVTQSWEYVDATLARFERQKNEVDKLKHSYENKCALPTRLRDARFAPIEESEHISSPPARASDATLRPPGRRVSLSAQKFSGESSKAADLEEETDAEKLKLAKRSESSWLHTASYLGYSCSVGSCQGGRVRRRQAASSSHRDGRTRRWRNSK